MSRSGRRLVTPLSKLGVATLAALFAAGARDANAQLNIDEVTGRQSGWTIGYSNSAGGCLAAASYNDGTTVWIGFDTANDRLSPFIAFTNPDWTWIEPKQTYDIQINATGRNWRGKFFGFVRGDHRGLGLIGTTERFLVDFARARGMVVQMDRRVLTRPNLSGSSAALQAAIQCQRDKGAVARPRPKASPKQESASFSGTGFVVSSDGHILTNFHVVQGCSHVQLSQPGGVLHPGRVIAGDATNDLALIATGIKPIAVPAFRTTIRLGETVSVYGFPLSGLLASSGNFTIGAISALAGLGDDSRHVQLSAPVQPGNSGGPLLDRYGNIVGVVVARLKPGEHQNVNFAIKAIIASNFLEANIRTARTEPSTRALDSADLADRAKAFTYHITCKPGAPPPGVPAAPPPPPSVAADRMACTDGKGSASIAACGRLMAAGGIAGRDLAKVYASRAQAHFGQKAFDRAVGDYNEAIKLDPTNADLHNRRGIAFARQNDLPRALADYDEAIRLDPKSAVLYQNRGVAYEDKQDFDRAIADFDEAIRLDPKRAFSYFARGRTLVRKAEFTKAVADFGRAIEIDPKYVSAYISRGAAFDSSGEVDKAIADFTEAIRLQPENANTYNARGVSYFRNDKLDLALVDFDHAIRLDANMPTFRTNRGRVFEKLGRFDDAIFEHDAAIRLSPRFALAYANRGIAYEGKGQRGRALVEFEAALAIEPTLQRAIDGRNRVR